jgi:hypothetical protein
MPANAPRWVPSRIRPAECSYGILYVEEAAKFVVRRE